jgi:hypothetical protein
MLYWMTGTAVLAAWVLLRVLAGERARRIRLLRVELIREQNALQEAARRSGLHK